MGSACCVAARDRTIQSAAVSETFHRNTARYSPTWSFRWDNRRRVVGEETSLTWLSDGINQNYTTDMKYEPAYASEVSSLDSFNAHIWQKSPASEGTMGHARTPTSDQSISRNTSMDVSLEQMTSKAKELMESPAALCAPAKSSLPLASQQSSLLASPLPSQSQVYPASTSAPKWTLCSPGRRARLTKQVSDTRVLGMKSPNRNSAVEENRDGSSDGWSMHAFSELMAFSCRDSLSFDYETPCSHRDKIAGRSSRTVGSPSTDLRNCGACSRLLSERSLWSSQKIFATNELSVVAVLTCGHVYHAECLEHMTPEIDKYDPVCPVCTLGEKKAHKLSERAVRAEMELKVRNNKRLRNRVVDSDLDGDLVVFDRSMSGGLEEKGKAPKIGSSSSMKSLASRPSLMRHFLFGSKGNRSPQETCPTRKKGLFWTKSSKT